MKIRSKFKCVSKEPADGGDGSKASYVNFRTDYDDDTPEDQRFATATPSGEMRQLITNPLALKEFKEGECYYFDAVACTSPLAKEPPAFKDEPPVEPPAKDEEPVMPPESHTAHHPPKHAAHGTHGKKDHK